MPAVAAHPTATVTSMPPKISVVVPVFDPGRYIEPNIDSLLRQSLASDEYEVIYVDDGSTDGTGDRLDVLAREHRQVRVIHIPNSGWPGRPRNIGIAEARGEYIQLMDQDDRLGREALERLSATGRLNRADIVIGKVTSDFRPVPHVVFRKNRAVCTIEDAPLIQSLTIHKCFRTAFLRDDAIRFPEGPWILEDQRFMVEAYLRARVVSILGDYPSYFYMGRDDGGNAYTSRFEAGPYFANVGTIMDLVVAETAPGAVRDSLLLRLYRSEVIGRLTEPVYLQHPRDRRRQIFDAARHVAVEQVPDRIHETLSPIARTRSAMLRADRKDDLLGLAEHLDAIGAAYRVTAVRWRRDKLRISITAGFVDPRGEPALAIDRRGDRSFLDPSVALPGGEEIDVTDHLLAPRLGISLREPASAIEWIAPTRTTVAYGGDAPGQAVAGRVWPSLQGRVTVDPVAVACGGPLAPGRWDFVVQVFAFGLSRTGRPVAGGAPAAPTGAVDGQGRVMLAIDHGSKGLTLQVDAGPADLAAMLRLRPLRVDPTDGRRVRVHLPVRCRSDSAVRTVWLILETASTTQAVPAILGPGGPRLDHLVVSGRLLPRSPMPPTGDGSIALRLGADPGSDVRIAGATFDGSGRVRIQGVRRVTSASILLEDVVVRLKRVRRRVVRRLRPTRRGRTGGTKQSGRVLP